MHGRTKAVGHARPKGGETAPRRVDEGRLPAPEVLAQRLARLQAGHRKWRQQAAAREAAAALLPERLEDLVRHVDRQPCGNRVVSACLLHLGGYTHADIAAALGYSSRKSSATTISKMLQTPAAQRIIDTIRRAQVQRVLRGDFGVTAQAPAPGPVLQ